MSFPNDTYRLRLAMPQDSGAIGAVLESGSYPGKVQVRYTRRPDAYRSLAMEGERLVMPVAELTETGQIIGTGGCILRGAYVNGELVETGYLTGLKLLEEHRKKMRFIKEAYGMIHEQTRESCRLYTTTILSGNSAVAKMLEKPRKGMPTYRFHGTYTVFCAGTRQSARFPGGLHIERNPQGLAAFYGEHLPAYNLAPSFGSLNGLSEEDFLTLRDSRGDILAACALWDQRDWKQYTVTRYEGTYALLPRLPLHSLGYPRAPKEGVSANYVSLALTLVRPDSIRHAEGFLRAAAGMAKGYDFVMMGFHQGHPLHPVAAKLPHIRYESRLYTVEYPDCLELDGRPVMLEVGML